MPPTWGKFALALLKRSDIGFGEKLELVERIIPKADVILGAQMVSQLLEAARTTRPSKEELYFLCEASENSQMLAEYLRGFFMVESDDRLEMAERLEQVLSFRFVEKRNKYSIKEKKLHQTVAEYLLRNRN